MLCSGNGPMVLFADLDALNIITCSEIHHRSHSPGVVK